MKYINFVELTGDDVFQPGDQVRMTAGAGYALMGRDCTDCDIGTWLAWEQVEDRWYGRKVYDFWLARQAESLNLEHSVMFRRPYPVEDLFNNIKEQYQNALNLITERIDVIDKLVQDMKASEDNKQPEQVPPPKELRHVKEHPATLHVTHICDGEQVVMGGNDGQTWIATFADANTAKFFISTALHCNGKVNGIRRD